MGRHKIPGAKAALFISGEHPQVFFVHYNIRTVNCIFFPRQVFPTKKPISFPESRRNVLFLSRERKRGDESQEIMFN